MNELSKRYSIIIAYSPAIGREKVDMELDKLKAIVKGFDGNIEKFYYLGLKQLAYEIKKCKTAHYVQGYFWLPKDKNLKHNISEINRKIGPGMNATTLRHMIIHIEHNDFNFECLKSFDGFDTQIKI